jgi:hypothetical protein
LESIVHCLSMSSRFYNVSASSIVNSVFEDDYEEDSDEEDFFYNYYTDSDDEELMQASDQTHVPEEVEERPSTLFRALNSDECGICLDKCEDAFIVKDCGHTFCRSCISDYVSFKVQDISTIYHKVCITINLSLTYP